MTEDRERARKTPLRAKIVQDLKKQAGPLVALGVLALFAGGLYAGDLLGGIMMGIAMLLFIPSLVLMGHLFWKGQVKRRQDRTE